MIVSVRKDWEPYEESTKTKKKFKNNSKNARAPAVVGLKSPYSGLYGL
jgi:hypothetical protein